MFMSWPQMEAAWRAIQPLLDNGVEDSGRSWDDEVRGMMLRPYSRSRVLRVEPRLLEQAPDGLGEGQLGDAFCQVLGMGSAEDLREDLTSVHKEPLGLEEVQKNFAALHQDCTIGHVCGDERSRDPRAHKKCNYHPCGLPRRFWTFDIFWWVSARIAYKTHRAIGVRNRKLGTVPRNGKGANGHAPAAG